MSYKTTLVTFILIVASSCVNRTTEVFPEAVTFSDDKIRHIHLVNGNIINLNPITGIYRFEIIDSLLICSGTSVDNSCKMHIYNLKTNKRIVSFADEGRGPGEFIRVDAFYISRIKREVHIIDNNQQLLINYPIDSLLKDSQSAPSQRISFSESAFTPEFMIDSSTFLCEIAMPFKSSNVITRVRYPSFEKISATGYPPLKNFDSINLARHYQNVFGRNVSYNDEAGKIAVAYASTDLIEIYDEDLNRLARIHGPDHFIPEYEVRGTPKTYSQISYQGKTYKENVVMGLMVSPVRGLARYGYVFVTTTSEGVYAVYSGDTVAESNTSPPAMRTIYFFDYKGNARRKYTVESGDIYVIKADQSGGRLFTLYDGNLTVYNMEQ